VDRDATTGRLTVTLQEAFFLLYPFVDDFKLPRLPRKHVVTTDARVGLTPKLADEAMSKLGVKAVHSCEGDFDSDGVVSFI